MKRLNKCNVSDPQFCRSGYYAHLSDNKFSGGIEARYKVGIDVIRTFLIIGRLKFNPRMIVGQNVGKPILRSVNGHIGGRARFLSADMLQLFVLFREPKVRISGHDAVMFGEVLQLNGFRRFNHRIG